MHLRALKWFVYLLLISLLEGVSRADDGWEGHIVALVWENDATAGSDRHYTQGARIAYLSKDQMLPMWLRRFSLKLPEFGYEVEAEKFGLSIAQELYTPEDLRATELLPNDRPYAGWLSGTATLQRRGKTNLGFPVMENFKVNL